MFDIYLYKIINKIICVLHLMPLTPTSRRLISAKLLNVTRRLMSFVGSLRRVKIRENTRSLKSFIMSNDSRAISTWLLTLSLMSKFGECCNSSNTTNFLLFYYNTVFFYVQQALFIFCFLSCLHCRPNGMSE